MAISSHVKEKNTTQSHILSWTKEYCWLVYYVVFSECLTWNISDLLPVWHCPKVCHCICLCVCVCVDMHKSARLTRCAPPPPPSLLAVHSRQGSDQPCVVFSDGARTWSLSRGNGLFSLPCLHKEPHCSSPHIPHWLPTPGFGLPGWRGLRLQELFFIIIIWSKARNIV